MADKELKVRLKPCAHTSTEWAGTYKDKVLLNGEIGYEKNTGRYKIGDGTNKWADLPWAKATPYGNFIPLNTSGGIGSISGGGKYEYCLIATVKISKTYINRPITFEISGRGFLTSIVQVMFLNADNTDPGLGKFTTNGYNNFYIVKSDTSTWKIYGTYTEVWGDLILHRITGSGSNIGVTVNLENVDALPTGTTKASYYGNVSYATNAGSATQANKLTVNAGSSTNPVYFSGGVPTACSGRTVPGIKSASEVTTLGWGTNNNYVADISLLSYWNGAYSGTSSNLAYCKQGAFGTIVTKNSGDYLAVGGTAVAAKKLVSAVTLSSYDFTPSTYIADGGVVGLWNNNQSTDSNGYPAANSSGGILFGRTNAAVVMAARAGQTVPTIYVKQYYQSWGDWALLLHSSNYTSYTVKKDGTGASGTWGINISGNAATATKATQDGSGNTITSTYLKLTGGTLTISSYYGLKIKRSDANGSAISYLNSNGAIGGAGFLSDGNFQISSGENTNGNIFKASITAATFPGTVTATKFIGNLTGNADTAGKWSTARKITLTGSVTGSVSIDGSGDVSLATTTNHTHGLLHSSFAKQIANTTTDSGWSMINDTYMGYILMSLRTQADAPPWIQNNYAAGIVFGGADTKGVLSMAYGSPKITFAGGNGTKPVWYFTLTGTSATTYNLDTFAKKDGSNASGTWGISITGNAATANQWATARTLTIGDTGKSVNGSGNVSWTSSEVGYRHEWSCIVTCSTWSRLCYVTSGNPTIGASFLLNIGATRGNVVYNDTFIIKTHHHTSGKIIKISGHNYSLGYQVRLLVDTYGHCYVELYDNINGVTSSTTQTVYCRLIPIYCDAITKYTSFTSGTSLPSGFSVTQTMTLDNNDIQANIAGNLYGNATTATRANTVLGSYTHNGGQQNPNYFGTNKVGFLMMDTIVNGNGQYKDWMIMDCYYANDVGGGVAFGVNRQSLGAYIMRSDAARTSWAQSAELLGTHNYSSYALPLTGGTLTGHLTIGNSTRSSCPVYGIAVHDLRDATILPSSFGSGNVNFYFKQINGYWNSVMHMTGWDGTTYAAWELAGNSNNDSSHNDLLFRQGLGSNWQNWQTVLTSANYGNYAVPLVGNSNIRGDITIIRSDSGDRRLAVTNNNINCILLASGTTAGLYNTSYGWLIAINTSGQVTLPNGGTLSGALNLANGTWNKAGDDAYFGDNNTAGSFAIKGINGATNLKMVTYGGSTYGTITWNGNNFNFSNTIVGELNGNASSAGYVTSDNSMRLYAQYNNEVNFGGTNNSNTIFIGYRAVDSKPIPSTFYFGGSTGTATLVAAKFKGALEGNADSATKLNLTRAIGNQNDSHATALQNEFNSNKASISRNNLNTYYSGAYGNGSFYMGYFLNGYDSNPYGGFFVAHYGTPFYVGISNGSFYQQSIITSANFSLSGTTLTITI